MHSIGRTITIAALLFASGCRIDTNQPPAATTQGTTGGATAQSVSVTSVAAVASNGLTGEASIADNFDGTAGIEPTTYGPNGTTGFPLSAGDGAAAFRMFCTAGQLVRDDPLVYPGQVGVSHLHQFFGNTGTNANSNYQSLRTSGGTTCGQASTPFNRSAYWFPAMLDGVGNVVKPDFIKLYYKRNSANDPMCRPLSSSYQSLGQCVDLPNGLRYVFGYNMTTGAPFGGGVFYSCVPSEDGTVSNGAATGRYSTIAQVVAAGCPVGAQLVIAASSPNCWDGLSLDTPDHRSHMAYANGPWYAGQLFNACTSDHPYPIPNMEVLLQFTVDANFAKWHLVSDEMVPGAVAGSTFHMDYWEAWSPAVKGTWHQYCLNGQLSCSSGDLGNGTDLVNGGVPWPQGFPKHQLVSLSSIGGGAATTPPTTTVATQVCPDGSVIPLTQGCPVSAPVTRFNGSGKAIGRKK